MKHFAKPQFINVISKLKKELQKGSQTTSLLKLIIL